MEDDEKKPFCNNCGKKLEKEDDFCTNCGKSAITPYKRKYKSKINHHIIRIVMFAGTMIILGLVVLNSLQIPLEEDTYSKVVEVGGMTFNIPEDYVLNGSDYRDIGREYGYNQEGATIYYSSYTNGSSSIYIDVAPNSIVTLSESKKNFLNDGRWIVQDTTIGGYFGFKGSLKDSPNDYTFQFEKNGAIISVSTYPYSENDIAKIIADNKLQ